MTQPWNATPAEVRQAAVAAVMRGEPVKDVARDTGICARTIRRWCGGKRGVYLKPAPAAVQAGIARRCLCCGGAFAAESRYLRLCPTCRTQSFVFAA